MMWAKYTQPWLVENISVNICTFCLMAYSSNSAENISLRRHHLLKYLLISTIILKFFLQSLQPWFYLGVKYFYYRAKIFLCTYVKTWRDLIYSKLSKSFLTSYNIKMVIYHSFLLKNIAVCIIRYLLGSINLLVSVFQIKVKSVEELDTKDMF